MGPTKFELRKAIRDEEARLEEKMTNLHTELGKRTRRELQELAPQLELLELRLRSLWDRFSEVAAATLDDALERIVERRRRVESEATTVVMHPERRGSPSARSGSRNPP